MQLIKTLAKSDRRRQWAALKSKHAKAIAAKKLDFDAKFGPLLDKYQAAMGVVDKLFARQAGTGKDIEKVVALTRPLRNVAEYYRDKAKGLGDPAEKELVKFLKEIESDCQDWEKALDAIGSQSVAARNSPVQIKAVREVYGELDALGQQLINLGRSLPDMKARVRKVPAEAKYKLYVEESKNPVPEKQWQKELAADMKLMEAHGTALLALTTAAEKLLQRLLTASVRFDETADYAAFKDLAQSFAAAPVLKDFKQRALVLDDWMQKVIVAREDCARNGMSLAGADIKDVRRAVIGAAEAGRKLVDPVVKAIGKLP